LNINLEWQNLLEQYSFVSQQGGEASWAWAPHEGGLHALGVSGSQGEEEHVIGGLHVVVVVGHFDLVDGLRVGDSGQTGAGVLAEGETHTASVLWVVHGEGAWFVGGHLELSELDLALGHVDLAGGVVVVTQEDVAVHTDGAWAVGFAWLLPVERLTLAVVLDVWGLHAGWAGFGGLSVAWATVATSGAVGHSAVVAAAGLVVSAGLDALLLGAVAAGARGGLAVFLAVLGAVHVLNLWLSIAIVSSASSVLANTLSAVGLDTAGLETIESNTVGLSALGASIASGLAAVGTGATSWAVQWLWLWVVGLLAGLLDAATRSAVVHSAVRGLTSLVGALGRAGGLSALWAIARLTGA